MRALVYFVAYCDQAFSKKETQMKNLFFAGAVLAFGASIFVAVGAPSPAAQGPAGAGASTAAQDNTHMLNPMNWMKKDSKNSADAPANRTESEKKLTPALQAQGALPANVNATDACASFKTLDGCLAALHASHNLGVDFNCLRAGVTGVHINADMSGCKAADGEKSESLNKVIHQLKPDANAKQATKDAEQQAKDDLKAIAG
jgi:hypothetical protein